MRQHPSKIKVWEPILLFVVIVALIIYAVNAINKIRGVFTDLEESGRTMETDDPTASFVLSKGPVFKLKDSDS